MQNVLGTGLALGIILGGFALTGDLGRLAARGMRVIQSTDVPDDEAPIPVAASADPEPAPSGLPAAAAATRPPQGLDAVDMSMLAAGSRIRVWLGQSTPPTAGASRCIALDVVDPTTREALVAEMPPPSAPGLPAVAPAPPRRALVAGSGPAGTITRGGALTLRSRGIAGDGGHESLGPIVALDVTR